MSSALIETAKDKFGKLMEDQLKRVERMKQDTEWIDYSKLNPIIIGICWGDGIGEFISKQAQRVLEYILKTEVARGKIVFRDIKGLTIENRENT